MEDLIIKYLKKGKSQREISDLLKQQNLEPNSLSFIEKFLKTLRAKYKAKTMFHLGFIMGKESKP